MPKDFSKMTLVELFNYLEDLDYEASITNESTSRLLEKAKVNSKMSKDLFSVLNNTLLAMKSGSITVNGEKVSPYEKQEKVSNFIDFAVPVDQAEHITSSKNMGEWLNNFEDWEITHFNFNGTEFESTSKEGDSFSFNVESGILKVGDYTYKVREDFTDVLHISEQGIYLFKKVNNKLEGVSMIRWKK